MYMEYLRPHTIITQDIFYLKKDTHRMKDANNGTKRLSRKNALGDAMRSIQI